MKIQCLWLNQIKLRNLRVQTKKRKYKRDAPYCIVTHMALDFNGHTLNTYSKADGKECRTVEESHLSPSPSHLHLPLTKVCKLGCYSFCHPYYVVCRFSVYGLTLQLFKRLKLTSVRLGLSPQLSTSTFCVF